MGAGASVVRARSGRGGGAATSINQGGGNKKEGLVSTTNRRAEQIRFIRTRADGGNARHWVFCMNQLGGVGHKWGQASGPGNRGGVHASCKELATASRLAYPVMPGGLYSAYAEMEREANLAWRVYNSRASSTLSGIVEYGPDMHSELPDGNNQASEDPLSFFEERALVAYYLPGLEFDNVAGRLSALELQLAESVPAGAGSLRISVLAQEMVECKLAGPDGEAECFLTPDGNVKYATSAPIKPSGSNALVFGGDEGNTNPLPASWTLVPGPTFGPDEFCEQADPAGTLLMVIVTTEYNLDPPLSFIAHADAPTIDVEGDGGCNSSHGHVQDLYPVPLSESGEYPAWLAITADTT